MISKNDAVKEAKDIVVKASPKFSFILQHIGSKDIRDDFLLVHAYLRCVDDVVDDPANPISYKKQYIERQKKLIDEYKRNIKSEPLLKEEIFLYYFFEFALKKNLKSLIESVSLMLETISWDVNRLESDGLYSRKQMNEYFSMQLKSTYGLLYYFIYNHDYNSSTHENFSMNYYANSHMLNLRDLKEDIEAGLINICREDIENFSLDIENLLEDKNLGIWIKEQIDLIIQVLYSEIHKIKVLPLKIRILYFYFSVYYSPSILRYKYYGYYVGSSDKRSFIKELRTYWQSFIISLKLLKRIYF
ncbi:hypothetical protein MNBD_IGNAVI01-1516 [hydrothermal vent metagenome]|uniref:Phytoene synthase n=1 Tax=hydrothermal vent metagenome TaxID=652676 RepID=A0A3B1DAR2_9ZZZZ